MSFANARDRETVVELLDAMWLEYDLHAEARQQDVLLEAAGNRVACIENAIGRPNAWLLDRLSWDVFEHVLNRKQFDHVEKLLQEHPAFALDLLAIRLLSA